LVATPEFTSGVADDTLGRLGPPVLASRALAASPDGPTFESVPVGPEQRAPRSAQAAPVGLRTDGLLALMATIWAINYSIVKYGVTQLGPTAFNAVRIGLAVAVLMTLAFLPGRTRPSARERRALLLLGVLGHGIYQLIFVIGLSLTRAGNAALVSAANPAVTALVGAALGVEHVGARAISGIALSFAGIGVLIWGSAAGATLAASAVGDVLVLVATSCWALYSVLLKAHAERVEGVQMAAWTLAGGWPLLLLVGLPALGQVSWTHVSAWTWGSVAYGGLCAMVIAYLLWYHGVRHIGPTRTALYGQLQPVIAVLFAWAVLGEVPTVWQGLGAALVLAGLVLARR
jgi:drug/metabolite transporter (DMT)-like permease